MKFKGLKLSFIIFIFSSVSHGAWLYNASRGACEPIVDNMSVTDFVTFMSSNMPKKDPCVVKEKEDIGLFMVQCGTKSFFVSEKVNACNLIAKSIQKVKK